MNFKVYTTRGFGIIYAASSDAAKSMIERLGYVVVDVQAV